MKILCRVLLLQWLVQSVCSTEKATLNQEELTTSPEDDAEPEDKLPDTDTQTTLSNSENEDTFDQLKELLSEINGEEAEAESSSGPVVRLKESNFKDVIAKGYTFVKFFAPWCGHCNAMADDWVMLAEHFIENPLPGKFLTIAEIDCTSIMDGAMTRCITENVDSYPTIRAYQDGQFLEEYQYDRSYARMKKFIYNELLDANQIRPNDVGVYELNDGTFHKFVESSGDTIVVSLFHVDWCPHCKELKPIWDDVAINFLMEEAEDVKFIQVNCEESREVCSREDIDGYPQIYIYKNSELEEIFDDDPTYTSLSNFIWETVDPSRVEPENDDDFNLDALMMMPGMFGGGEENEEDNTEEEQEEEEEECDCSEPDCDCEDEEGEEEELDLADIMMGGDDDEEDDELTAEEIAHLEQKIAENKAKKEAASQNKDTTRDEL